MRGVAGAFGLVLEGTVASGALLLFTVLTGCFLAAPSRGLPAIDVLESDYVRCLRRYDGVTYAWGGESSEGDRLFRADPKGAG